MKRISLWLLLLTSPALALTTQFGNQGTPAAYVVLGGTSVATGGAHDAGLIYWAESGDTITSISVTGQRLSTGTDSVRVAVFTTESVLPDLVEDMYPKDSLGSVWLLFTTGSAETVTKSSIKIGLTPGRWTSLSLFPSAKDSVGIGRDASASFNYFCTGSTTYGTPYPADGGYTGLRWEVYATVTHTTPSSTTTGIRRPVTFVSERDTLISAVTASSIQIGAPSSLANGDLLIAFIVKGDDPFAAGFTPPASQGWTKMFETWTNNLDDMAFGLFYKFVKDAAAEPSSYTFTWFSDNEERSGGVMAFRNVDQSNPFDCTPGIRQRANVSGSDPITPAITTRSDSAMIVSIAATSDPIDTVHVTVPSGMTSLWTRMPSNNAYWCGSMAAYVSQATAGTTGTKSWAMTGAVTPECFEITLALRPSIKQVGQVTQ